MEKIFPDDELGPDYLQGTGRHQAFFDRMNVLDAIWDLQRDIHTRYEATSCRLKSLGAKKGWWQFWKPDEDETTQNEREQLQDGLRKLSRADGMEKICSTLTWHYRNDNHVCFVHHIYSRDDLLKELVLKLAKYPDLGNLIRYLRIRRRLYEEDRLLDQNEPITHRLPQSWMTKLMDATLELYREILLAAGFEAYVNGAV